MNVARRVVERKRRGDDVAVVVSAMADTTDDLISLAKQIDEAPPERELDMLLTAGERISMALLSIAIRKLGVRAASFTGSQSGIITDDDHTRARIIDVLPTRIIETMNSGAVAIVAGFQGVSGKKEVTTLGRGGSDTTAVALGVALGAEVCEIYTDVEGIFSADPRRVASARLIEELSFEETLDLAYFGAGVIHSRAVELARVSRLPLLIASSLVEREGTRIMSENRGMERPRFVGLSRREDVCFCRAELPDSRAVAELFGEAERERIQLGLSRAERTERGFNVSFLAEGKDAGSLSGLVQRFGLRVDPEVCLVGMVGEEISRRPGVLAEAVSFLDSLGIVPHAVETTQISIAFVLKSSCGAETEKALHEKFIRGDAF